jgi:hypothetical protein
MDTYEAIKLFSTKIQVDCNPGDVLIIHSTILHRGIFTERLKHRRLIQIFELFPSINELKEISQHFLHIRGKEKHSKFMIFMSSYSILSAIPNLIGYMNAATGYGHIKQPKELSKKLKFLSSEGLCNRLDIDTDLDTNSNHPINKYIINYNVGNAPLLPIYLEEETNYICYLRKNIIYSIILIIVIILKISLLLLLVLFIRKNIRNTNTNITNTTNTTKMMSIRSKNIKL